MKTPLQELIAFIEQYSKDNPYFNVGTVLTEATALLPKEREGIEKARLDGFKFSGEGYNGEYPFEGEPDEFIAKEINNSDYFTQTYEQ